MSKPYAKESQNSGNVPESDKPRNADSIDQSKDDRTFRERYGLAFVVSSILVIVILALVLLSEAGYADTMTCTSPTYECELIGTQINCESVPTTCTYDINETAFTSNISAQLDALQLLYTNCTFTEAEKLLLNQTRDELETAFTEKIECEDRFSKCVVDVNTLRAAQDNCTTIKQNEITGYTTQISTLQQQNQNNLFVGAAAGGILVYLFLTQKKKDTEQEVNKRTGNRRVGE